MEARRHMKAGRHTKAAGPIVKARGHTKAASPIVKARGVRGFSEFTSLSTAYNQCDL